MFSLGSWTAYKLLDKLNRMKSLILSTALFGFSFSAFANLQMQFEPQSAYFDSATREYRRIWSNEGNRVIEAMETHSGVSFAQGKVKAIVFEGVSSSGRGDIPMKLRASYPNDTKKATLVHELGHRLLAGVPTTPEIDEHRKLFLVLYDIWVELYGRDFADAQVLIEKKRKGRYDYESAWNWALSFTPEQRFSKFKELNSTK